MRSFTFLSSRRIARASIASSAAAVATVHTGNAPGEVATAPSSSVRRCTPISQLKSDDWAEYSMSYEGKLRDALKQRLCSPDGPIPIRDVYHQITNSCRLLREFDHAKTTRRVASQRAAIRFLRRHNILLHGLLYYLEKPSTWNTTREFGRLALFGESVLRAEVRLRLLKLFPTLDHSTYTQVLNRVLSEASYTSMFDELELSTVVGARPTRKKKSTGDRRSRLPTPPPDAKSSMLCAIVGEMRWFTARTKATDRTHNNALFPPSDVLILHVLCAHLLECVPAELLYRELEPLLQSLKEVWVNAPMSLPLQLHMTPRTIGALSLTTVPQSPSVPLHDMDQVVNVRPLTAVPEFGSAKSYMRPLCNNTRFDAPRYQVFCEDKRGEPAALSATRTVASGVAEEAPELWNDARRRMLVQQALQQLNISPN